MAALTLSLSIGVSKGDTPPGRVVSLDLCTDWMLVKYARPSQVLALSPLVRRFPVSWIGEEWPSHDGSLEQLLELEPDLVLAGEYNALLLRQRLQKLGVRVEVLSLPRTLEQVTAYERRFHSLLGRSEKAAAPPPFPASGRQPPSRLLLLGANGIGTGRDTFEDELIRYSGWRNYLEEEGYIPLDLERLISAPPDAVLWAAPDAVALAGRFAEHPALKKAVPPERWFSTDYWRWQCPGPWSWALIGQLEQWKKD